MRASEQSERSRRRYRSFRRRNDLNDRAINTRHTALRNRKSDVFARRSRDRKPLVAKPSVCMASLVVGGGTVARMKAVSGFRRLRRRWCRCEGQRSNHDASGEQHVMWNGLFCDIRHSSNSPLRWVITDWKTSTIDRLMHSHGTIAVAGYRETVNGSVSGHAAATVTYTSWRRKWTKWVKLLLLHPGNQWQRVPAVTQASNAHSFSTATLWASPAGTPTHASTSYLRQEVLWSGAFVCWLVSSFVCHRCWECVSNVAINFREVKVKVQGQYRRTENLLS